MVGRRRSNRARLSNHIASIGHYVLCTPCKESWERADYNDLYSRRSFSDRVDDLAQLAGDTIRIPDRDRRDDGFGYDL